MTDRFDKALLPAGLSDVLPPDAQFEVQAVERLMATFAAHGYERVKPPLIEFEESLLSGGGSAMAGHTFRLMDPVSQRMMALRADMTLQVARIATTRLGGLPRPLRLSYAGQVLRIKGSQLRPERQFGQVGAELIGAPAPGADAEVILMAKAALEALDVPDVSIDLGQPTLIPALCGELGLDDNASVRLRTALDRKDSAAVEALGTALGGDGTKIFAAILRAVGPADEALERLGRIDLPDAAAADLESLGRVVERVRAAAPDLKLTVDAVENRGFEYHTGVTFTIFMLGVRGELGRGGRYLAGDDGEPATGLTLFTDMVLRAMPNPTPVRRVFVPAGTPADQVERLRTEGWVAVAALEAAEDEIREARRLRCGHVLVDGAVNETGTDEGG